MQILGVGLSKTGTTSLHTALEILGYRCIHNDSVRLNHVLSGEDPRPNFRCYDDIDAVTDIPAAFFYTELMEAYPTCKAILTVRSVEAWWASIERHFNQRFPVGNPSLLSVIGRQFGLTWWPGKRRDDDLEHKRYLRNYVYGAARAKEFLYKRRYLEHNRRVQVDIPAERLLIMDITAGDGWEKLCPFLDMKIPNIAFPIKNRSTGPHES